MVDAGEAPEAALRRELEEELGYGVAHLEPIADFFVSPGGSSERIWLYYAEVDESRRLSAGGGLAHEHEEIRVVHMSPEEARAALDAGRLPDAKTIIGLQWLFGREKGARP
jgi:ADP-ribose pyrophosphatase